MTERRGGSATMETDYGPVVLARTESLLVASAVHGDDYQIDIALPDGPAPAAGWPSIYLLDAAGCFGTCVEALRRMSRRTDATGVSSAVVVGISSPGKRYDVPRRQRDFTTARMVDGLADEKTGGAPAFLQFIEDQIKPLVADRLSVDPRRQTLFGHSLAGYFTLWAMFHRPQAFRTYVAISPSIWWDRNGLFQSAAKLDLRDRRVFMAMGEWEEALPPWQRAFPGSADVVARRKARAMVANARDLTERLKSVLGEDGAEFSLLPQEDHASIVSASIPRMLRLATRDENSPHDGTAPAPADRPSTT